MKRKLFLRLTFIGVKNNFSCFFVQTEMGNTLMAAVVGKLISYQEGQGGKCHGHAKIPNERHPVLLPGAVRKVVEGSAFRKLREGEELPQLSPGTSKVLVDYQVTGKRLIANRWGVITT